jgi:hypothetical protein
MYTRIKITFLLLVLTREPTALKNIWAGFGKYLRPRNL